MYHHKTISYNISKNINFKQIKGIFNTAFTKHEESEGLSFQYDHKMLKDNGIKQSMAKKLFRQFLTEKLYCLL